MVTDQCSIVICHRWWRFAQSFLKCRAEGASENDKGKLNLNKDHFFTPSERGVFLPTEPSLGAWPTPPPPFKSRQYLAP